ncbi:MAG: T9SS type A sorting domain-containing protein, partial [Bacteroidales bacterium]
KYRIVSIDDYNNNLSSFYVYPNPTTDFIYIINQDFNDPFAIYIYNMNGQLVFAKLVSEDINSTIQIPVSSLNSGTYIIRCEGNNKVYSSKFIKE